MSCNSFKIVIKKLFIYKSCIFNIYIYKHDLAIDNCWGVSPTDGLILM